MTTGTVNTALAQAVAAFGSGLGPLFISHDAAERGLETFRPIVEKVFEKGSVEEWNRNLPAMVAYAALIGRVTAQIALHHGRRTVISDDLKTAVNRLSSEDRSGEDIFGRCPFFMYHPY
jgi:histone H3/H4